MWLQLQGYTFCMSIFRVHLLMYGFTFLEDLSLFCRRLFDLKTYSLHMEQLT